MFCQRLQCSALSPEADGAVTAALAPGMGMTRKPAARSASTSATLLSCCSKAMTFSVAPRSLCWCSASRRVSLMP